jgi:hypothetical protein
METQEKIRKSVTIEQRKQKEEPNTQTTGQIETGVILTCKELDFKIEVGYSRSQMANREIALAMFDAALEKIFKI